MADKTDKTTDDKDKKDAKPAEDKKAKEESKANGAAESIDADAQAPINTLGDSGAAQDGRAPQLRLLVQYVKDLSFENPNAPMSLSPSEDAPNMEVGVDVKARKASDTNYECIIQVTATAKRADEVMFVAELAFGGMFALDNIPEESIQPVLLIECPRLLFPFARRIVADVCRDGGFPPLMLDPIDFAALYRAHLDRAAAEGQGTAPAPSAAPVN